MTLTTAPSAARSLWRKDLAERAKSRLEPLLELAELSVRARVGRVRGRREK